MRFLLLFSIISGVYSVGYFSAVRYVDPYGEFGSGHFRPVVMDSRREKVLLFKAFARHGATDGLILGTSRSMLLRPSALAAALGPGSRIFNFAVENGHPEDFLAIYNYVRSEGANPRWVVIGVDVPSLHNDNIRDHMFDRSALKDYLYTRDKVQQNSAWQSILDANAIFTKDYCLDSFKAIWMEFRDRRPATGFTVDGYEQDGAGGTIKEGTFSGNAGLDVGVAAYKTRLAGMTGLSALRVGYLRQLVTDARNRGARVTIWLTPVHPRLEEAILDNTNYGALTAGLRDLTKAFAAQGVECQDFTRLEAFGGSESAWQDATHMDSRNLDMVARQLAGGGQRGL
jgi:hypothetical protein